MTLARPSRLALAYAVAAALWFALSHGVSGAHALPDWPWLDPAGDVVFLALTAGLLFLLLRRSAPAAADLPSDVPAAAEQTYRQLFERHPTPLWVYDFDTRAIIAVNDSAVRAYGYRRDEFLGLRIDDLRPAGELPRLLEHLRGMDPTQTNVSQWLHRRKDGTLLEVEVRSHEIALEGRRGRLIMAIDVTERRRAERALAASEQQLRDLNVGLEARISERTEELRRAKERAEESDRVKSMFLANVSHELRTPLNSIVGFSDLMLAGLSGDLAAEQLKQVGIINASGRHLLALITDFLDISKIEAGALSLDLQEIDLGELLRRDIDAWRAAAAERGLAFDFRPDAQAPLVSADPRRVRQIIDNLLSNAIKFTDQGAVTVTMAHDGRTVRASVADTGIGISPDELSRLFEPFVRIEARSMRTREGTGLGLAIARRLARAMGGTIDVESSSGRGSTFTLSLPSLDARIASAHPDDRG